MTYNVFGGNFEGHEFKRHGHKQSFQRNHYSRWFIVENPVVCGMLTLCYYYYAAIIMLLLR